MVFRQAVAEECKRFFRIVDNLEKFQILRRYRPGIDKGLEVDDLVPVLAAINDDQDFLGQLVRLGERQDFKKFVHRAEAAGEDYESLREIREPELAHEEIVKLEIQRRRDELVGMLLERQLDVQPDAFAARFK